MSPTPPEHLQPHSDAIALTEDGREVRVFQPHEGGRIEYAIRDDRFADGWRPVMDADEISQLVASINARPADPDPETELREGPAIDGPRTQEGPTLQPGETGTLTEDST